MTQGRSTRSVKLLLDPGHSSTAEGAMSIDKLVGEHEVNLYQADILKNILTPSFTVDIIDPDRDDLTAIGLNAKNYDAFISLHCNALNRKQNYVAVCVASRYSRPQDPHVKLASKCACAMGKAQGIKTYTGPLFPIGVMSSNLMVLNAAHKAGCNIVMLTEAFFIDFHPDEDTIKKACDLAMAALALTLKKEFQ